MKPGLEAAQVKARLGGGVVSTIVHSPDATVSAVVWSKRDFPMWYRLGLVRGEDDVSLTPPDVRLWGRPRWAASGHLAMGGFVGIRRTVLDVDVETAATREIWLSPDASYELLEYLGPGRALCRRRGLDGSVAVVRVGESGDVVVAAEHGRRRRGDERKSCGGERATASSKASSCRRHAEARRGPPCAFSTAARLRRWPQGSTPSPPPGLMPAGPPSSPTSQRRASAARRPCWRLSRPRSCPTRTRRSMPSWPEAASPIERSDRVRTPMLLLYGTHSTLVRQGQEWHNALRREGARSELVVLPGAGHTLDSNDDVKELHDCVTTWLRTHDPLG